MKNLHIYSIFVASLISVAAAYTVPNSDSANKAAVTSGGNRRAFLSSMANAAVIASSAASNPSRAIAADNQEDVYFGAGCFWHVQHEFISAERNLLGRKDNEMTSLTGYAGGMKTGSEGRVCYHNFQSVADYGKLGHGEVVGVTIPQSSVGDFAVEYFKLFGDTGERADPMDKGGEYRSLLGLPGGRSHPMFRQVETAAANGGMTLVDGKGNDPDTLGKHLVYVYDSRKFPFYQAEVYHQYHNDFLSAAYGKQYNELADAAVDDGRIKITGCPDRVHKMKNAWKENEEIILGVIGVATICMVVCGICLVWSRPKFLYMPLYDSGRDSYEKDSDIAHEDIIETEMAEGLNQEREIS